MIYKIRRHDELLDRFPKFKVLSLRSLWKKWKRGAVTNVATVCDHKDKLVDWCCYCSVGCEMCRLTVECADCHEKFEHKQNAYPTVRL